MSVSRRRRFLTRSIALAVCLAIGAGISLAVVRAIAPSAAPVAAETLHAAEVEPPRDPLRAARDLARAAEFTRAAELCRTLLEQPGRENDVHGIALLALCDEGLADWESAFKGYSRLADAEPPTVRDAARLGTVRCLVRSRRYDRARNLLDEWMAAASDPRLVEEIVAWRAAAAALARAPSASAFSPLAMMHADFAFSPEHYVDWPEASVFVSSKPLTGDGVGGNFQELLTAAARLDDHPLASHAALEIGNLLAREGKLNDAARQYERLADAAPDVHARRAEFNLALIRVRQSNFARARDLFLRVVDRRPDDETAQLAWWWIGRTHLDAGDQARAEKPLRRAAAGRSTPVAAAAALALASLNLLTGDADAAHAALSAAPRSGLRAPALRDDATFLDAFARYQLARRVRQLPLGETESLLWSLSDLSAESLLGATITLLRGMALRELGMDARMAELFALAIPKNHGPLAVRMTEMAADHFLRIADKTNAKPMLLALSTSDDDGARTRSRLRLARLALDAGRPAECLEWCRGLPIAPNAESPRTLMGLAYQALGDPRRAAESFAGQP